MSFNPIQPHNTLSLLPPKINPKDPIFSDAIIQARTQLAELKGYSMAMPNPMLLISSWALRESIASSNIENINTTIVDVLQNQLFPETEQRKPDKEVLRYRDALLWGFENIKVLSLSSRLILGIENKLIQQFNGDYRKHPNQIINNATKEVLYTPPTASEIPRLMENWENFVNKDSDHDPLLKCAMAHYQFEAIHPFNDGNGRAGRILMVLQLVKDKIISFPTLFISAYINENRGEYYKLLLNVTQKSDWHAFIIFILNGLKLQAIETKGILFKTMALLHEFKNEVKSKHKKIYSSDLVESLFIHPIINPSKLADDLGIHYTTASRHLYELASSGLLKEGKYGKFHLFINHKLLNVLKNEKTT